MNSPTMNDRQAIQNLFIRLSQAWDAGDGVAYGRCFTADADYVTFNGEHLRGRQAIDTVHQQLWNGVLRGSKLLYLDAELTLRFLSPELAIAHATGIVQLRFHKKPPTSRQSINSNVLLKVNGEWQIAAFHNCRIKRPNWLQRWMIRSK
ncbi:SgcJ/EcaC family oxidoreductase [Paenibacillus guangzhouensis]|uniref:SgcJ/EcaC family oxidoreductase n=1 Tax=Paenibacillus guangzhouensis TaxID=1473112 RepID=UPI001266F246|nr:SgcJ/EcaC family oxidoreductase [Paenibacillus guangzhouensis]